MTIEIFAPATIGNVGPGFDVLGLAVDGLGDRFRFRFLEKGPSVIRVEGRDASEVPLKPKDNVVTQAAQFLFDKYGSSRAIDVSIFRELPISGGLGASAASSVAGAMAAAHLLEIDRPEEVLEAALFAESQVAGRHLDNIGPCFYGGLTIVHRVDPPEIVQVPCQGGFSIVLVTPPIKMNTKKSRALLPNTLNIEHWVQQMAHTSALVMAFVKGDANLLRHALIDPFAEPQRAPMIPGFYVAQKAALKHGALAFTISGGGPTCFSVCENETISRQVGEAVSQVFGEGTTYHIGPISTKGAHIL